MLSAKTPLLVAFVMILQWIVIFPAQAETQAKLSKRMSPVVFPAFSETKQGQQLAYGIADKAGALLFATGTYNHFHLMQVLSMAKQHQLSLKNLSDVEQAISAAIILGAQLGVTGKLKKNRSGSYRLTFTAFDIRRGKNVTRSLKLPQDAAKAVSSGAWALAKTIAAFDKVRIRKRKIQIHPTTRSNDAMTAYLGCYELMVKQPLGLRQAHIIGAKEVALARQQCIKAVRLDPKFRAAWAAMSLAYVLSSMNTEAADALAKARLAKGYLPLLDLAHYWLATRFQSSQKGTEVLRKSIANYPGALLFLNYLGQHLNIIREYKEALAVWNQYLEYVMKSPDAMAQKGYSLARLNQFDESIRISEQGSRMDPASLNLKLEFASRLIDAKQYAQAEQILLPMAEDKHVFGEVLLRLGYIYLLQKQNQKAEKMLSQALQLAKGPQEWRTRGRTRYDLAIIMARKGALGQAEQHLIQAANEGFLVRELLAQNEDLQKLSNRSTVAHLFRGPEMKTNRSLVHLTPFPVDNAGEILPNAKRQKLSGVSF